MPSFSADGNFDNVIRSIERATGDYKPAVDQALEAAFAVVTPKAEDAVKKPNLPRGGKYSHGGTEKSLKRTPKVSWEGDKAFVDTGFSVKGGGLPSIFMIKGKPSRMKNTALYNAFYGQQTLEAVNKAEADALNNYLDKTLGG